MNHRSPEFIRLSKKTIKLLKNRLDIPANYTVFFTSSATECWEIIAQSLIVDESMHIFNGAFGEKWYDYTKRLRPKAQSTQFDLNKLPNLRSLSASNAEVICLTQNETSNGTQVPNETIVAIKKLYPKKLIAVDATSSMGGVYLNFKNGDIWFASVQKCFGLPAGLAVMICSPQAMKQARKINEQTHYNSLSAMDKMMAHWQTTYTPNVLGIYLFSRMLEKMGDITKVAKKIVRRHNEWLAFFCDSDKLKPLAFNTNVLSKTVIAIKGNPDLIKKLKSNARKKGLLLGEGYGNLKAETFRIANFPAIRKKDILRLMNLLKEYK